jgi:phosphoserine / homoserine phosphotransferase
MVCLDLEGVLVPEIWIAVAERTGIDDLRRTTRDEPDYDVLMRGRLALLHAHGLTMSTISEVIATLRPLDGACAFLDALRDRSQVIILSDTFEQFAAPLLAQLGRPAILCHRLVVDGDCVVDYRLRMADQKRHAYRVVAAGDSYNDASMLAAADAGIWFHAPPNVLADHPDHPSTSTYGELLDAISAVLIAD